MTSYLRPTAFVYGPDAKALVAAGEAAPVAGLAHIAFTKAEWIDREGAEITRHVVPLQQARQHPAFAAISSARPDFGPLALNHCHVMGIVNATPDSFSDGGKNLRAKTAIAAAQKMIADGASLIDIGGESTRPGADEVPEDEELARVTPLVSALAKSHVVSVDTRKAKVMAAALAAGAAIINDVSALQFDANAAAVVAKAKAPVILMHAQGLPKTMQDAPTYADVTLDIYDALATRIAAAEAAGIARANIMVDPGFGFGKTYAQNVELLQQLAIFHGLGVGLLIGLSRKGFIGAVTGEKEASRRVSGSVAGALLAALQGAQVLRVHDVKETFTALQVLRAGTLPSSGQI